jgi:hypothetical protein
MQAALLPWFILKTLRPLPLESWFVILSPLLSAWIFPIITDAPMTVPFDLYRRGHHITHTSHPSSVQGHVIFLFLEISFDSCGVPTPLL